jgi:hypothetical protein
MMSVHASLLWLCIAVISAPVHRVSGQSPAGLRIYLARQREFYNRTVSFGIRMTR